MSRKAEQRSRTDGYRAAKPDRLTNESAPRTPDSAEQSDQSGRADPQSNSVIFEQPAQPSRTNRLALVPLSFTLGGLDGGAKNLNFQARSLKLRTLRSPKEGNAKMFCEASPDRRRIKSIGSAIANVSPNWGRNPVTAVQNSLQPRATSFIPIADEDGEVS
ncbi:hypothetical protein U1Q18_005016 [Sarracenia purpurea var. burkii]